MTQALDDFARRRTRAAEILDSLADRCDGGGGVDEASVAWLRTTARRAREGRFVVLLLGCFSSGKSTLLNALLGQPVLPVKVNPCTAILTEVVHAEEPVVRVRHRDGTEERMDVATFLDRFQLRAVAEDVAGAEADDRFGGVDRAIVGHPLPLLGQGVVLLDTPGLDDDPRRTARTLASLPDADAVIVVLSANRFLTDLERRTLNRELLPLGLSNLFFPVTMVDLLGSLADDPEAAREDLRVRAREVLSPLCEIAGEGGFERRFFLLDARGALQARWDRATRRPRQPADASAWTASGLASFEHELSQFLVRERGRVQLAHLRTTAAKVQSEVRRRAELDRATADASVEQLRRRQEELEPSLRRLDAIARRVGRTVDGFVARQQVLVWEDLRAFVERAEQDLPEAVAGFDLGGVAGLDLFTERGRRRVEQALRRQLEAWLEARVAAWQGSLRPTVEASLRSLRAELAGDAADFDALAASVVTDFAGGALRVPHGVGAEGPAVDPVERWFSVAMGAVLLSPGAMAAGWAEGYEGALKGAAGRLGVRLALLTLGALLGPVGWAGLVLYAVSDAVLLVLSGGSQLQRLREQVADGLRGKLVAQVDGSRDEVAARVREGLLPLRDALVEAAAGEAREVAALLERTVAAREQAAADARARSTSWEELTRAFQEGVEELETLAR